MKEDEIDDISEKSTTPQPAPRLTPLMWFRKTKASICRECSKTGFSTMRHT